MPHRAQPKQNFIIPELDDADAFPVTETVDRQGQSWRHHRGFNFKLVKELKTAVNQYGATAPYTTAIVESVAENWLTPGDWQILTRATLSGEDYLLWKSEYIEACKDTARRNAEAGNGWNLDMLTGEGNYSSSDAQMQYDAGILHKFKQLPLKLGGSSL